MPELDFAVTGIKAVSQGIVPLLKAGVRITTRPENQTVQAVLLHAQIHFQCPQRPYSSREKERLSDLFGAPERWGQTLRDRLWAHAEATAGAFTGSMELELRVPCSFDLNLAATKYLHGLEGGEVPLLFLFSGSIFAEASDRRLQVERISWNKECRYRMPAQVWRDLMQSHYPDCAWLYLQRDCFERLYAFRRRTGCVSWEQTIEHLLPAAEMNEVGA